jgi:hypothetical protein
MHEIRLICHVVKAIIARYNRAVVNLAEARTAFKQLTDAAPVESVDIWQASIEESEQKRCHGDPTGMDIMHSRINTGQTLKEMCAAIMTEDGRARDTAPENGGTTDWLVEGFSIEDEQWVAFNPDR